MDKKQNPQRKKPRADGSGAGGADETMFDNWLENKLKSAYSSVLDEPIPEDLIRLISQKLKD